MRGEIFYFTSEDDGGHEDNQGKGTDEGRTEVRDKSRQAIGPRSIESSRVAN